MTIALPIKVLGRRIKGSWKESEGFRYEQIMAQNYDWDHPMDLEGVGKSGKDTYMSRLWYRTTTGTC